MRSILAIFLCIGLVGPALAQAETYKALELAQLKADARKLDGTRVVIKGKVVVVNDELGSMFEEKSDPGRIWLHLQQASAETREDLLSRCKSIQSPCTASVKGRVKLQGADITLLVE